MVALQLLAPLLLLADPDPLESMKERLAAALPSKMEEIRALKLKESARACFALEVVAWMANQPKLRLRKESIRKVLGDQGLAAPVEAPLELPGQEKHHGPICDPSGPCDTCGRPLPDFCQKMRGEERSPPPPPCPTLGLRYVLAALDASIPTERAGGYEAAMQIALGQASNAIAAGECRPAASNVSTAPRLLDRLRALESNPRACREGP